MGDYGAWMLSKYRTCQEAFWAERKKTIELTAALREICVLTDNAKYEPGDLYYLINGIEELAKGALGDD